MAEVEDVAMHKAVLRLCVAVAEADDHVAEGESNVLASAVAEQLLAPHPVTALPSPSRDARQPTVRVQALRTAGR